MPLTSELLTRAIIGLADDDSGEENDGDNAKIQAKTGTPACKTVATTNVVS
jgi:hypothetical protein